MKLILLILSLLLIAAPALASYDFKDPVIMSNRLDLNMAASVASATITDVTNIPGNSVHVTGTTTITKFANANQAGIERTVVFDGVLTLTHNASFIVLPGGANITTAAGDIATFFAEDAAGKWRCTSYTKASVGPAETALLDGLTAGTVTASKAVVVDANKDIGDFRNVTSSGTVTAPNIANGSSGAAGTLSIYPSTESKGYLRLQAADNTGDTAVIITNAEQSALSTYTVPDAGSGYFVVSTAALTLAEADTLDAVTAGTVTASKAVVVDANKDIGDFRNLDAVNIDAGASGTAGTVDVFPATESKGKLTLSVADQTGDTAVTVNANAMGQATTINLADPGASASYVVQSTAALTLAEADYLDGAVAANSVASKVALLDGSKSIQTNANVGSANTADAAVTVVEFGDGYHHTTYLTVTAAPITIGDSADYAGGYLLYTLPAGAVVLQSAYMNVAISATDAANQGDTPDVGIGTRIASGVQATLDAAGTNAENLITGQAAADSNGTATTKTVGIDAPVAVEAANSDDRYVYFNYAAAWSNGDVQTASASGTVVIEWVMLKP